MAWDSTRPVPWQRLIREWLIYVGVMAAIFVVVFRSNLAGAMAGLLISGPLYLGFGFVLAKLGYQRKTMKELRSARESRGPNDRSDDDESTPSSTSSGVRPAPTSRTSTGRGRPGTKPNRRKR